MRHYALLSTGLLGLLLAGCRHDADLGPCYAGTVLGETCLDGVLIQVDEAYPIGKPAVYRITSSDSLVGTNVVAAVNNPERFGVRGQRIYFTYSGSTDQHGPPQICTANTVRLDIPHLIATNLSSNACAN
ncbi:MAG: hypothetical protein EOO62_05190 [Hymenobacter sp.]|nr:MAG: hypothetical protein EOO62_05190 [Hymenobacter sp.]